MGHRIDLTIDATDAPVLAQFWKLALGYVDQPPPAPFTTRQAWLVSHGVPEAEWNSAAYLCDPDGVGPVVSILEVPEPKTAKNRLHMDIRVPTSGTRTDRWAAILAFAATLVAAGGSILREDPDHHIVMADPEGNEFCLA
jgi:hypothetical protein